MVSSTFTDLKDHRAALIEALRQHDLHADVMENDGAMLLDVIDSSLQKVRDSAAYIGVIGLKYGQTPECSTRNPQKLSITELEFNEAQGRNLPILLFIMGDDHAVKKGDIEKNARKEKKLNAFRERAKRYTSESSVDRVYAVFNSLQEFKDKLGSSLAKLSRHLELSGREKSEEKPVGFVNSITVIPKAPSFYAEPDYLGSHRFIGREAELQVLSDWAKPADPTNVLLFEAIGGNGKSMLTWEWTTNSRHALAARPADSPWAGRFWYSFYERGAIMADFCQRALAYMTGCPLEDLAKKKTAELKEILLAQLHARPWLLILDGLERVLVAYHRIDAAEVPDEEANAPTDKIVNRNPCDAIRDEDNDLLRALSGAAPSKILISSRLTPRVLLNPAGQPIPGVRRITLPGLRPPDAEALLRSCGIEGNSAAIQSYLSANCDNNPLVIGILGGLIANYLPARGDFDTWSTAADGGAALNLASLNLIQRRNHILRAALDALPPASKQLLSTLALLTDSVEYETLKAFNPHLPPEPEKVEEPTPPEEQWRWERMSDEEKSEGRKQYESALGRWEDYERAVQARLASAEFRAAPKKLEATVTGLEQRGLLQWDGRERKYNLHPVVRRFASDAMSRTDRERHGRRVVDHFTAQPHRPYEEAETMEDVRNGLHVVRTLLKLEHHQQAASTFLTDQLSTALVQNLAGYAETLSLLQPFYPNGWEKLPEYVVRSHACTISFFAAFALSRLGQHHEAINAHGSAILADLDEEKWTDTSSSLALISSSLSAQNHFSKAIQIADLAIDLDTVCEESESDFPGRVALLVAYSEMGRWAEFATTVQWLVSHEANELELDYFEVSIHLGPMLESLLAHGTFLEEHITFLERNALKSRFQFINPSIHRLCGDWRLERCHWALAAASYQEAVRLARERSLMDAWSETGLALAKHHLRQASEHQSWNEIAESRQEAERLAQYRNPAHRYLAQLWLALDDTERAKHHALAAHEWAWADGEPYVRQFELTKTIELLQQLDVPVPKLPPYDPARDEIFAWEADVRAAIEKLRAQKEAAAEKLRAQEEEAAEEVVALVSEFSFSPWEADVHAANEELRAQKEAAAEDKGESAAE
jgi:Domain of unknown function (DUF4062)